MTRNLHHRGLALLIAAAILSLPATSFAAQIPSSARSSCPDSRAGDLATLEKLLRRQDVADVLASRGLSTDEVEQRLNRLSDEDLRHLASNVEQIQAAGTEVPEYIWWLAGGLLAVLILAALF